MRKICLDQYLIYETLSKDKKNGNSFGEILISGCVPALQLFRTLQV